MPDRPLIDPELETYAEEHSTPASAVLEHVTDATFEFSPKPEMMIDALEGRFLAFLVAMNGARHVLEIGTFTGYSAIVMAQALPDDGQLTSLELSPEHAAKAREHVALAGLEGRIRIIEGPALDSLRELDGPYDLIFIDADKSAYPDYYELALERLAPDGLIVADNVFRSGRILEADSTDPNTVGMRDFNDRVATDERVECVVLTVRDGITLIRRR